MQVSVEQLEGLERRLTVQVPAETVEKEIQSRLQRLTRNARLDGFRPGKVPFKLIKRMYGSQVRQEVIGELMQSSFQDALRQENLQPAGGPKVEPVNLDEGQHLEYQATFEIMPEFTPQGIAGRNIQRPVAEVTDADVDKMIESLRKQRAEWRDVERPAQAGDRVTIDYQGSLDGEDFPGGSGENNPVVLGQNQVTEDFENALYGQVGGGETEFDVTFPADYPREMLAGRTAHFKAQVKSVAEPILPEVDDDFTRAFGIESGGVEALRKALHDNMERELAEGVKADIKRQVMDALLQQNDIPTPQAMVEQETDNLVRQAGFKDGEQPDAATKARLFEPAARRRVALGLITARLLEARAIRLDEERVRRQLETMAASYEDSNEVLQWYMQNPRLMEGVYNLVLEEQLVDSLLSEADVEDKTMSFDEVMRSERGAPEGQEQSDD